MIFKSRTAYIWISSSQQSLLQQTLVRLSHVVLRIQQYLQEQGAVSVLQMFLKSISKWAVLRHSTNYFLVVAASIILSPRFSEVLFRRGRHSKWPMSIITFWNIVIFFCFRKSSNSCPLCTTVWLSLHCFECLCSNYLSTVAAQLSTIPRHWTNS